MDTGKDASIKIILYKLKKEAGKNTPAFLFDEQHYLSDKDKLSIYQ